MKKARLGVNGTLMRGLELNNTLLLVGAQFIREAITSPAYRIWSIDDRYPAMIRDPNAGREISLEIWELTPKALVMVLDQEPPGLCVGRVELQDRIWVFGVLGEPYICEGQMEITEWGGWRQYIGNQEGT